MTDWTLSIVLIVPAALQDKANRLSCALGHDVLPGNTFSVPLSDNGETVTHYGCRTSAKQEFVDLLTNAGQGEFPDTDWSEFGLTITDVQDALAGLIVSIQPVGDSRAHFMGCCEDNGLEIAAIATEPTGSG